jgi:LacI family transcriptional regulator
MAVGAMGTARELGLAIPKDVAIIGYDDIEAASLVTPALTTISTHAYEQGHSAGQLLLDRMNGTYQGERRKVLVPHRLIERESV